MITQLEKTFEGVGDVSGWTFRQLQNNGCAFIYERKDIETGVFHYEVFERTLAPLCIDFEKRIYSDTDFKEVYPKSSAFGNTAFCCSELIKAISIFNEITTNKQIK